MHSTAFACALLCVAVLCATAAPASGQESEGQDGDQPSRQEGQPAAASDAQVTQQTHCPVLPDEEIDPEFFTDYKGKRVYFCCARCLKKFNRDPEKYAAGLASIGLSSIGPGDTSEHGTAAHLQIPEREPDRPGTFWRWLKWLGGFHPPTVNFPIGALVAGALAELLFMVRRRVEFDHAARFCVVFAALSGAAAGVLGWFFAGIRFTDSDILLAIHRWLGTGTVLWLLLLLWSSERARKPEHPARGLFRVLLFGGVALVLATGFFGGAMVYGPDHYMLK